MCYGHFSTKIENLLYLILKVLSLEIWNMKLEFAKNFVQKS